MVEIIKYNNKLNIAKLLTGSIKVNQDIATDVTEIITQIKQNGNKALFSYNKKFDNFTSNENNIKFSQQEIESACKAVPQKLYEALHLAYKRILEFHQEQYPEDKLLVTEKNFITGWKWSPLDSVGLYVPGGLASYPSSVLMSGVIAKVAGVKDIIMVMPCPSGDYNPAILACAKMIGITEIYKVGGAQAIAALAYGSTIIPQVHKIVGPGNAYVAEAKKQVFGDVGIDMIAGPSEVLIIADSNANPKWLAYDLLSQAEHDPKARSLLITDNAVLANQVKQEIAHILPKLKRYEITSSSWSKNGKIILVDDLLQEGVYLSNKIAPEHLQLMVKNSNEFVANINNAGAIFIGSYSPEALGDYIAGPSHILPTSGTARFSSGLSIYDFLKKISIINCSKEDFINIADKTSILAESEGLECHAQSIKIRQ